jgi:hypothetical protein
MVKCDAMRFAVLFIVFSMGLPLAGAQAAVPTPEIALPVTACKLSQEPQRFEGKLVRVRGIVSRGFEVFIIGDSSFPFTSPECGANIWLEPGGDGKGPRPYVVLHPRWPQADMQEWAEQARVDSVRLQQDQQYQEMLQRLSAYRQREPDGTSCEGLWLCSLYKVTATITGRFFAMRKTRLPDGRAYLHGYGHMGCCHLLVIEQVTDLLAERTAVPEEGEFACSRQSWEPTPEESARLADTQSCPSSSLECKERQYFSKVAAHWGDPVDIADGSGGISYGTWISSDLTLRYSLVKDVARKKKKRDSGQPTGTVRIDRDECKLAPTPEQQP